MKTEFKNLTDLTKKLPTEIECIQLLATIRWGEKPVCVHCGCYRKIYVIANGNFLSVRIVADRFPSALVVFLRTPPAFAKMVHCHLFVDGTQKGNFLYSAWQGYWRNSKNAWFMLHRIRYAVRTKSFEKLTARLKRMKHISAVKKRTNTLINAPRERKDEVPKQRLPFLGLANEMNCCR